MDGPVDLQKLSDCVKALEAIDEAWRVWFKAAKGGNPRLVALFDEKHAEAMALTAKAAGAMDGR